LPRSITSVEVERMLKVDRRSAIAKRDYVIVLLLVTYGLRASEAWMTGNATTSTLEGAQQGIRLHAFPRWQPVVKPLPQ